MKFGFVKYLPVVPVVALGLYLVLLSFDFTRRDGLVVQARDFVLALKPAELKEVSDACVLILNGNKDEILSPRDESWNSLPSVLLKLKPRYISFSKDEMYVILGESARRDLTLRCNREGVVGIQGNVVEDGFKFLYPEGLRYESPQAE